MRKELKKLTSDSAVYGLSNFVGRFITFLLVPFYTNVLPPDQYGILIGVYSYIGLLNAVFTFGLEPAYMRFVIDSDHRRKQEIFSTSVLFVLTGSLIFVALTQMAASPIASLLELRDVWHDIVLLAALTIAVDAFNAIPFASLRMDNKAKTFAVIRLASIVTYVGLNVFLIVVLKQSIVAVFAAGLVASLLSTLLLLPTLRQLLKPRMQSKLLGDLLRYGLPALPAALATVLIPVIDKIIMLKMTDAATLGIYAAAYKLGIFMMLLATVFRYAWQPFYLQMADKPEAKEIFSRVLTYFVLIASFFLVVLSLFIQEIVSIPLWGGKHLIKPEYWGGLGIVPIILFSYIWAGMAYVFNAGFYIEKRTKYVMVGAVLGALINITANLLLIPVIGMYGAAFAALLAYFSIALYSYFASRKVYPMTYEGLRLAKIAIAVLIPAVVWYSGFHPADISDTVWKVTLLLVYLLLLLAMGFFTQTERKEIRRLIEWRR